MDLTSPRSSHLDHGVVVDIGYECDRRTVQILKSWEDEIVDAEPDREYGCGRVPIGFHWSCGVVFQEVGRLFNKASTKQVRCNDVSVDGAATCSKILFNRLVRGTVSFIVG